MGLGEPDFGLSCWVTSVFGLRRCCFARSCSVNLVDVFRFVILDLGSSGFVGASWIGLVNTVFSGYCCVCFSDFAGVRLRGLLRDLGDCWLG